MHFTSRAAAAFLRIKVSRMPRVASYLSASSGPVKTAMEAQIAQQKSSVLGINTGNQRYDAMRINLLDREARPAVPLAQCLCC